MLSKEEISKLKINVFNQCDDETIRLVAEMLEHINQLESDKQKLIDKLEEDKIELTEELKYNTTKRESRIQLKLVDKYLEILKGENDEH